MQFSCGEETDMFRHAVITPFLGQTKDRFSEYNQPRTLEQNELLPIRWTGLGVN